MNLKPWKSKQKDVFSDFFELDHPFFQLGPLATFGRSCNVLQDWSPAIDVSEDAKNVYLKVDLPGLKKDNISLVADGSVLTIKGERNYEKEVQDKNVHRVERAYGAFQRSIDIGTQVDPDKVQADYKDGVLALTVAKSDRDGVKKISIN